MNNSNSIHFPNSDRKYGEAYIKSFAQRTGEQAGLIVSDFLTGILVLLLADRTTGKTSSTVVNRGVGPLLSQVDTNQLEKLLTANEVAEHLNISKGKAYQLMSRGKIPSVQFDRTTRVRKQDLEKFVESHRKQAI